MEESVSAPSRYVPYVVNGAEKRAAKYKSIPPNALEYCPTTCATPLTVFVVVSIVTVPVVTLMPSERMSGVDDDGLVDVRRKCVAMKRDVRRRGELDANLRIVERDRVITGRRRFVRVLELEPCPRGADFPASIPMTGMSAVPP